MGTYIHAHIEVKKGKKWLHYGAPEVTADYLLFACLNGTCKDAFEHNHDLYQRINPVVTSKDFPEDISDVTKICLEMDRKDFAKLKNFGVIYANDLRELQIKLNTLRKSQQDPYDLEDDIFHTYIGSGAIGSHRGFDDARIVFWFDH